jgi:hypothetical protein
MYEGNINITRMLSTEEKLFTINHQYFYDVISKLFPQLKVHYNAKEKVNILHPQTGEE